MSDREINRISRYFILGLSLFAMLLVVGATTLVMLGKFNPSPGGDEGTAARLFQLTIVLPFPTGLTYLFTADRRRPKEVIKRLAVPMVTLIIAFLTLYYVEYLR